MRSLSILLAGLLVGVTAWTSGGDAKAYPVAPMDCTFSVQTTVDGVKVDVTISVSTVSIVECALIKRGVNAAIKAAKK